MNSIWKQASYQSTFKKKKKKRVELSTFKQVCLWRLPLKPMQRLNHFTIMDTI